MEWEKRAIPGLLPKPRSGSTELLEDGQGVPDPDRPAPSEEAVDPAGSRIEKSGKPEDHLPGFFMDLCHPDLEVPPVECHFVFGIEKDRDVVRDHEADVVANRTGDRHGPEVGEPFHERGHRLRFSSDAPGLLRYIRVGKV